MAAESGATVLPDDASMPLHIQAEWIQHDMVAGVTRILAEDAAGRSPGHEIANVVARFVMAMGNSEQPPAHRSMHAHVLFRRYASSPYDQLEKELARHRLSREPAATAARVKRYVSAPEHWLYAKWPRIPLVAPTLTTTHVMWRGLAFPLHRRLRRLLEPVSITTTSAFVPQAVAADVPHAAAAVVPQAVAADVAHAVAAVVVPAAAAVVPAAAAVVPVAAAAVAAAAVAGTGEASAREGGCWTCRCRFCGTARWATTMGSSGARGRSSSTSCARILTCATRHFHRRTTRASPVAPAARSTCFAQTRTPASAPPATSCSKARRSCRRWITIGTRIRRSWSRMHSPACASALPC